MYIARSAFCDADEYKTKSVYRSFDARTLSAQVGTRGEVAQEQGMHDALIDVTMIHVRDN